MDDCDLPMNDEREVVIGVCGGVGPAAGLLLHQHILSHTENNGKDQGHLNVCHVSRSEDTTDRTAYLLSTEEERLSKENPAAGMARTFQMMQEGFASRNARAVVGVPCNTFHATPIWDEFLRLVDESDSSEVKVLHMLGETINMIQSVLPCAKKIGLMSTSGTRQSRVYHDLIEPRGFEIVEVPIGMQDELHDTIYNQSWGIKGTTPMVTDRAKSNFRRYAELLASMGADAIILGCTEIPFAFPTEKTIGNALLIDPMVALARGMIREADSSRLKPLVIDIPQKSLMKKLIPSSWSKNGTSSSSISSMATTDSESESMDYDSDSDSVGFDLDHLDSSSPRAFPWLWNFYNEYVDRILMPGN